MKETKYKQTEVGMIPSDWEVAKLGNFVKKIDAGVSVNSDESIYSDNYVLKTSAIHNGVINYKEVKAVIKKDIHRLKCPLKEDCLIVSRMNTPDLVGECAYSEKDVDNIFLPDRLWLVPNEFKNKISFKLINYVLNTPLMRNAIKGTATGTSNSMKNISKGKFLSIECAFPPTIEEQQRIANALSDVDTLIANLEKLIAKKKNSKQGAMQQLLTGKKRLPGFGSDERQKECHSERSAKREVEESSGYKMTELGLIPIDWEVKPIKELGLFLGGGTPSTKNESFWKGNIPWISSADLNDDDIEHISMTRFITQEAVNFSATQICPQGTILIIARVGVGKLALSQQKVCTSQDFCNLIPSKENDSKFLAYALLPVMKRMSNESQGTSIKGVAVDEIKKVQIIVPSSKDEQTAIANVLSDMDAEIATLETKLAKYRTLKTGMMQQLLTGKIRLIK